MNSDFELEFAAGPPKWLRYANVSVRFIPVQVKKQKAFNLDAVMLFHINKDFLPGGFTGVDIFFVISGYVVTASILRTSDDQLFKKVWDFYLRRIQRIIPALVVCLLITSLLTIWFVHPSQSSSFFKISPWAFLGWSNNALISENRDYFAADEQLNPFLHTWSLGIESGQ